MTARSSGLEPAEAAFELVAVGDRPTSRRRSRARRSVGELDVDAMAPEPARLIDAGADEQPVEPGVEAVGSRSVGRSRQARTSAFWTASLAWSGSRRMSQAAASSREIAAPASAAKAS